MAKTGPKGVMKQTEGFRMRQAIKEEKEKIQLAELKHKTFLSELRLEQYSPKMHQIMKNYRDIA